MAREIELYKDHFSIKGHIDLELEKHLYLKPAFDHMCILHQSKPKVFFLFWLFFLFYFISILFSVLKVP